MKRIISNVMLVAAAAMAFFACQKPEAIEPATSEEVMLTFSSEKPAFDDETKTEWTGKTIQWSAGDKIRVAYTCDGVWQNAEGDASADEIDGEKTAKLYASDALDADKEVATFVVPGPFKGEEQGVYKFYGIYPSSLTSSTTINYAPSVTIDLPAEQVPLANSFDAKADFMVSKSDTYTGMPKEGENNGPVSLKWNRLTAHGHLTLKALAVDGQEKVESIVLKANADADMVGKHYVNFETQFVEKATEIATNVITIDGTNLTIDTDGNVSFWVSFLPCTWKSLTVEVHTDKATYTREIDLSLNQKTFVKNARNTLAIGMASATRVANATPVTDYSGSYVIVAKRNSEEKFYYMTGVDCEASTKRFVAELAGDACPTDVEDLDDTYKWEVSKYGDAYVVTCVDSGQSISWTSGNSAFLADTGLPFEITENKDGTFTFKYAASDGDRYISLNNTTGNNYFALYKSGQAMNLYLLPVTPDTTPKVTLEKSSLELTAEASEGTIKVSTEYVRDVRVTALVEEGSQEESEWLDAEYVDGVIKYQAQANDSDERTAYIEVYVNCEDGSTLSKGVVVTQEAYIAEPAGPQEVTIAEFLELSVGTTEYQLTGVMEGTYNTIYGNFYLNDGTEKILVYGLTATKTTSNDKSFASLGLKDGDTITIIGTRAVYNGTAQVGGPAYLVSCEKNAAWDAPAISFVNNIVTLVSNEGAAIYYTLDGTTPSESSQKYSEPFEIQETVTVNAVAVKDGRPNSSVATKECEYVEISDDEVVGGSADFATISATNTQYVTGKTTAGWSYKNCAIFKGGTSDSSPAFKMIGDASNRALCMNGKTSAVGSITSPTLTTGCGTLKFNYGLPFGDTKIKFRVDIMQNGSVVKTFTIDKSSAVKYTKYSHEEAVNVSGDFQIVFTNLSPSNSTSNKDRTAVWDIEWTGYKN